MKDDNVFIRRAAKDKDNPYGMIRRAVMDGSGLSFEARGVMGYILMKQDNWKTRIKDLMREGGIGRDKAYKIVDELVEKGYARRVEQRDDHGHFNGIVIEVSEIPDQNDQQSLPLPENPLTVKPLTEKPLTDFQEHNNNGVLPITDLTTKTERKKQAPHGAKDAPHPNTRPILDAYVECLGFTPAPSKFARLGQDAKAIAQRGYGPADVSQVYTILQSDPFWQRNTIPLGKILEEIEKRNLTMRKDYDDGQAGSGSGWTPEELERARAARRNGQQLTPQTVLGG